MGHILERADGTAMQLLMECFVGEERLLAIRSESSRMIWSRAGRSNAESSSRVSVAQAGGQACELGLWEQAGRGGLLVRWLAWRLHVLYAAGLPVGVHRGCCWLCPRPQDVTPHLFSNPIRVLGCSRVPLELHPPLVVAPESHLSSSHGGFRRRRREGACSP